MGVAQLNTFPLLSQEMVKGNEIANTLGVIIRQLRLENNLSQEKLAELGEFERSYISKVENGDRIIQFTTFIRFANALDMKASELMKLLENQIEK